MSNNFVVQPYNKQPFVNDLANAQGWENSIFEYYRKDIFSYVYEINQGLCYYCKTYIPYGSSVGHIEHIIDKDGHSEFEYKPENLTLACPTCNSNKGTQEVLKTNKAKIVKFNYNEYPNSYNDFLIVHAYLDNYDDHICFDDGIFVKCVNDSEKGNETIKMCGLTRGSLALHRENQIKISNSMGYAKALASQLGSDDTNLKLIDEILNNFETNKSHFFFINGILQEFARELNNDATVKRKKAVEDVIRLNISDVRLYRIMIIVCNISMLKNKNMKDLITIYLDVREDNVENILNRMIDLLELQKNIFGLKKYREMIKFLVHSSVNYTKISSYFQDIYGDDKIKLNKDIELIYKIKPFIDMCKMLDVQDILENINKYLQLFRIVLKEKEIIN